MRDSHLKPPPKPAIASTEAVNERASELSSPFSTGGGGPNFEVRVQAAFVVLMLTEGVAPCLPAWPLIAIKLQGRYDGYDTDDFIATAEERGGNRRIRLLAQIKHALAITDKDPVFAKVIKAAWSDFQNPDVFDRQNDKLALITGPLSATDIEDARILPEWARTHPDAQDFLKLVNLGNVSSDAKRSKLQAFRAQLTAANGGTAVTDDELWEFLKCYHLLGYDLEFCSGVAHSLLKSHICQFHRDADGAWARILEMVGYFNQNAGTITRETIPREILSLFSERRIVATFPEEFQQQGTEDPETADAPAILAGEIGDALMWASLLGGWNDTIEGDKAVARQLVQGP